MNEERTDDKGCNMKLQTASRRSRCFLNAKQKGRRKGEAKTIFYGFLLLADTLTETDLSQVVRERISL